MDTMMKEFVQKAWVKHKTFDFIDKREELQKTYKIYTDAGLVTQAKEINNKIYLAKYNQITKEFLEEFKDRIILERPPFHLVRKQGSLLSSLLGSNDFREISFYGVHLTSNKYLVRTTPENFSGHVPIGIAKTIIKLKQEDLMPMIWFIATPKEIARLVPSTLIDPLLVGLKYNGNPYVNYVVLSGIWGKDIEDLNKYFGDNE